METLEGIRRNNLDRVARSFQTTRAGAVAFLTPNEVVYINQLNRDIKKVRKKLADQGDPDIDSMLDMW